MLYAGIAKLAIPVRAITITIIGVMIPASTTADPRISAPTTETVWPMTRGMRTPASRRISKANSISSASTNAGKGTFSRWESRLIKSVVGIIS
ncbi:hypothetical protein D3C73_1298200 [compost metagenome]